MGPNQQVLENLGMSQGDSLYRDLVMLVIGMYLERIQIPMKSSSPMIILGGKLKIHSQQQQLV